MSSSAGSSRRARASQPMPRAAARWRAPSVAASWTSAVGWRMRKKRASAKRRRAPPARERAAFADSRAALNSNGPASVSPVRFFWQASPVNSTQPVLHGTHVRLEPLERAHIAGLVAAAGRDLALYQWSAVPQGTAQMAHYVESALAGREAGTALPFATVRIGDGGGVGSSRFFDIERWPWPCGHAGATRSGPDGCEIGYTWLRPRAVRAAAHTEAKLLMLTHAFEEWGVRRVWFHPRSG